MNNILSSRKTIFSLLFLQLLPLVIFPVSVYNASSQEWWLAALLGIMSIAGIIQVFRQTTAQWPWYLMGFAQGFNVISRLMMVFPKIMITENGQQVFNTNYTLISFLMILLSLLMLTFLEKPQVRMVMFRK